RPSMNPREKTGDRSVKRSTDHPRLNPRRTLSTDLRDERTRRSPVPNGAAPIRASWLVVRRPAPESGHRRRSPAKLRRGVDLVPTNKHALTLMPTPRDRAAHAYASSVDDTRRPRAPRYHWA